MKRVFVINPSAGRGLSGAAIRDIRQFFEAHDGRFDSIIGESRQEVIERSQEAIRSGAEQLVAVGGDGTMNAVVNACMNSGPQGRSICVAMARAGTGSDYFRGLVGGAKIDWKEIVLNPRIRSVDVGLIRYLSAPPRDPLYFLNITSIGMGAEVVRRMQRTPKWLPRTLRYLLPTLPTLFEAKPSRLRIDADGKSIDTDSLLTVVGKGVYAGGGMRFGGGVAPDDGWFEVTIFRPMSPWRMLLKTPKLYSGDYANEPEIQKMRARTLRIEADPLFLIESDGEIIGSTPVEITLVPKALRVCFPSTNLLA